MACHVTAINAILEPNKQTVRHPEHRFPGLHDPATARVSSESEHDCQHRGHCVSTLVTLGIFSNPDTKKKGVSDDILTCSNSKQPEPHVLVNGQMVRRECGAVYQPENA